MPRLPDELLYIVLTYTPPDTVLRLRSYYAVARHVPYLYGHDSLARLYSARGLQWYHEYFKITPEYLRDREMLQVALLQDYLEALQWMYALFPYQFADLLQGHIRSIWVSPSSDVGKWILCKFPQVEMVDRLDGRIRSVGVSMSSDD